LGIGKKGRADMPWPLIRAAYASVAMWCVIPMQDVLGLDSSQRMNQPSASEGSWEWRFDWSQVNSRHAERLHELNHLYGRRS
ncbi:MAG TPA: 4-alpha-glucanotransferase, partial [Accumulibacter sp.]|nr:4-alpha-glucanotransferase [Accumulibacter sp.]